MFPTACVIRAFLSEHARVVDRHTMPGRSPSCGVSTSRAIELPGIMFVTLGVIPVGHFGPNPYHPSPKVTNTPGSNIHSTFMENLICCLISVCS